MNIFLVNIILSSLLSLTNGSLFFENYIGKHKSEISEIVTENHKRYKLNTAYVNNSFNYLKYEDNIREITVLFFLNDDDTCRMIRVMSDYSNLNDLLEELNANYTKIESKSWQYQAEGKKYAVTLEEGDWFFTISVKEK